MDEAVEDGVTEGGITDDIVPVFDRRQHERLVLHSVDPKPSDFGGGKKTPLGLSYWVSTS